MVPQRGETMLELLTAIGGIVLVDLALSGDNALVIGAAAAGLPRRQQRTAILAGGSGAIVLRILLGIAATLLLRLPLLQAIGGAVLVLVAIRLLAGHLREAGEPRHNAGREAHAASARPARGMVAALVTILIADVTMSLDNVLAVGALAAGNIPVLAGGLLLSMVILLVGSAVVARLIERLPWLMEVAALVLGWTSAQMILHDPRLHGVLSAIPFVDVVVPAVLLAVIILTDVALRWRARALRKRHERHDRREGPGAALESHVPTTPEMTRQPFH